MIANEHLVTHPDLSGPLMCVYYGETAHVLLALPDTMPTDWPSAAVCPDKPLAPSLAGHSATAVLAAKEPFFPEHASSDACDAWHLFWSLLLEKSHGDPRLWFFAPPYPAILDPPAPGLLPDNALLSTHAMAGLNGLLAQSRIAARTFRQGITVVHCGMNRMTAFLVYRHRVWGVFEHSLHRPSEAIMHDLKEFQLAWLPDEVARAGGGAGSIFTRPVPDEAESFAPLYSIGPNARMLEGHGSITEHKDGGVREAQLGLLDAYSFYQSQI